MSSVLLPLAVIVVGCLFQTSCAKRGIRTVRRTERLTFNEGVVMLAIEMYVQDLKCNYSEVLFSIKMFLYS